MYLFMQPIQYRSWIDEITKVFSSFDVHKIFLVAIKITIKCSRQTIKQFSFFSLTFVQKACSEKSGKSNSENLIESRISGKEYCQIQNIDLSHLKYKNIDKLFLEKNIRILYINSKRNKNYLIVFLGFPKISLSSLFY